jgi:hypothetical protein
MDLEVKSGEANPLSGPWIELQGANNNLIGRIRNAQRFKELYQGGNMKFR